MTFAHFLRRFTSIIAGADGVSRSWREDFRGGAYKIEVPAILYEVIGSTTSWPNSSTVPLLPLYCVSSDGGGGGL